MLAFDRSKIMREAWGNAKFYRMGDDNPKAYLAYYMKQAWAIARAEMKVRRWAAKLAANLNRNTYGDPCHAT
jgi:hypothetical protein